MVADEVASPLTHIYNEIIGYVAGTVEVGRMDALFKKDDTLNKCNYRPVNVLVTVDKVFEKILVRQL